MHPEIFGLDPKWKGIVYLIPYLGASGVSEDEADKVDARVFFCPSNRGFTYPNIWVGGESRGSCYVQYCGWPPPYATLFPNAPSSIRDPARWLLYSDMACTEASSYINHADATGEPAGANCLFLDGHVEWVDISKLTVKMGPVAPQGGTYGYYLFPDTN